MSWVESELETVDLGDRRLNDRMINIVHSLGLAPGRTIPQTFITWSEIKACYNFLGNKRVHESKILNPHIEKTIERIKEYPTVLLMTDTSEIDYTTKEAMEGKERLSNTKTGLWLHPTLAVTPERLPLGVVNVNFWNRSPERKGKNSAARNKTPIEEKESYRWLDSYLKACEIAREVPDTKIIHITDREGDIIEVFDASAKELEKGLRANFIIRSQHDRLIEPDKEERGIKEKLWRTLKNGETIGEVEYTIPGTENRKGRKVKQELKAVSVTLRRANKNVKVKVNAVMAIETSLQEGEDPIVWIFITDLPINSFEDVVRVINYYLCRWEIELFFKVLKSGCKIEERQLKTADKMKNIISIFIILAWRVMFTMMMGRVKADISAGDLFDEAEWKSVYKILNKKKALPRKAPKLGEFILMVARLGGYVEQKDGGPPGVKVMWKGMSRMIDFGIAWEAFGG